MIRENGAEYHILLMTVPEPLAEVHQRLENWAYWSRDRIRRGQCASWEGCYRSPQHWEPEQPRTPVDVLDALEVFDAVKEIAEKNRWVIALWYIHRIAEYDIRRKLGIHRSKMVLTLNDSRRMVDNRLRVLYKGDN